MGAPELAMMEFERLKRRNQDYLLIETIKRVGPSNYSLLARLTGMNAETVRYKVSKQLGRYGLGLTVNINYGELGFSLGLLTVKANAGMGKSWLDHTHYLMLVTRVMGSDKYVCLYGIPYRFKKKYYENFETLKARNLIDSYSFTELYWVRYPPFRSELYDFDKKCWNLDWRKIDATGQEAGVTSFSVNRDPRVDEVDLKILKFLKEDPTSGLTKLGKDIKVNARTVRYHHSEHVVKGNLIIGNNVRWTWPFQQGKLSELMQIFVIFKNLEQDEVPTVRKLFNKLPFTWLEGGTEGKDYFALLDVPILSFHETMKHVETHVGPLRDKLETSILDSSKTEYLSVPDEMFDKRLGWRLFGLPEQIEQKSEEQRTP